MMDLLYRLLADVLRAALPRALAEQLLQSVGWLSSEPGIGSTNRPNDGRRLAGLANCDGQDVPLGPCHRFGPDRRKPHVTLVRFSNSTSGPRHAESLTPGRQYEASSLNERPSMPGRSDTR